uniref:Uncharacterized protein n=1 Tax=Sphaerodactylus townsendi TaxID=933632 RepID=A0ACB8ELE7_9SAUR
MAEPEPGLAVAKRAGRGQQQPLGGPAGMGRSGAPSERPAGIGGPQTRRNLGPDMGSGGTRTRRRMEPRSPCRSPSAPRRPSSASASAGAARILRLGEMDQLPRLASPCPA